MFNSYRHNRKAFSLIEVITVLFVISLGLVGVLSLIIQNVQSQSFNKSNIIAYQLAQEGLELVRKTRDTNWKEGVDWDIGLTPGNYYMSYNDALPISTDSDPAILYVDSNNFYTHEPVGNTASTFSRLITINANTADSMQVVSTITWHEREKTFNYILDTMLYDWK